MGRALAATEVEAVDLIRRDQRLVRALSLRVEPGEILAVQGPSGAGKTTLLRVVAGLIRPDSGSVVRPPGPVGMVFQEPRLLPWRTARQNVELVLTGPEVDRGVEWLERVGLGDALDVYPAALSGGMRQRVSIARALAYQAPLVLVDEPFAHLDPATAGDLREELRSHLRSQESTVIWVTHDPHEARAVAQRVLTLSGPPDGGWTLNQFDAAGGAAPAPGARAQTRAGDPVI